MSRFPHYEEDNTNLDLEYRDLNLYFKWCISTNGRWVYFKTPNKVWENCQYPLPTVWTEEAVKLLPDVFQSEVKYYRNEYLKSVKTMREQE